MNDKKPDKIVDFSPILKAKVRREKLRERVKEHSLDGLFGRMIAVVEELMFVFGEISTPDTDGPGDRQVPIEKAADVLDELRELLTDLTAMGVRTGVLDWDELTQFADSERRKRTKRWLDDRDKK